MAGGLETEYGWFPTEQESDFMLKEVCKWLKELKKLVTPDLAVMLIKEFLPPVNIPAESEELELVDAVSFAPGHDSEDEDEGVTTATTSGPKIRCPKCKDVIQSRHRHDFVGCKCGEIAIDGGSSYTRIVGNMDWELVDEE